MALTEAQFEMIFPGLGEKAAIWRKALDAAMAEFEVANPARAAMFLAQLAHESGGLRTVEENLIYTTPERILKVFGARIPNGNAAPFVRQPQKLANQVYANRNGNGDVVSGDGFRFRGRGPIQITFRENYRKAGVALGLKLEDDPDLLLVPLNGARAAAEFWKRRGLNAIADGDAESAFSEVTRRVHGDTSTVAARRPKWLNARRALGMKVFA